MPRQRLAPKLPPPDQLPLLFLEETLLYLHHALHLAILPLPLDPLPLLLLSRYVLIRSLLLTLRLPLWHLP